MSDAKRVTESYAELAERYYNAMCDLASVEIARDVARLDTADLRARLTSARRKNERYALASKCYQALLVLAVGIIVGICTRGWWPR